MPRLGAFDVPEIAPREGAMVELLLPPEWKWGGLETDQLVEWLRERAASKWAQIATASTLVSRRRRPRDLIARPTVARVLREAGCGSETTAQICRSSNVDAQRCFYSMSWTSRKILDFELARSHARIVIVDDCGLDPSGEQRLVTRIRAALAGREHGFVVLRYASFYGGHRWRPVPRTRWCSDSLSVT